MVEDRREKLLFTEPEEAVCGSSVWCIVALAEGDILGYCGKRLCWESAGASWFSAR